jgi:hypothetical protein
MEKSPNVPLQHVDHANNLAIQNFQFALISEFGHCLSPKRLPLVIISASILPLVLFSSSYFFEFYLRIKK